jgi:tyrosinase
MTIRRGGIIFALRGLEGALARSTAMPGPKTVELLGANNESLRVVGTEAGTSVTLDAAVQRKVSTSLESAGA